MTLCSCGSSQLFEICCGQYLKGAVAPTAEALMRSRYSAFVKHDLAYIEKTSAGEARLLFNRAQLAATLKNTEWLGLTILNVEKGQESDPVGFVTFKVQFRENGQHYTQTERSEFRRMGDEWRYWKGEFDISERHQIGKQVGRNDPCPCGSGKKFKKCCGA